MPASLPATCHKLGGITPHALKCLLPRRPAEEPGCVNGVDRGRSSPRGAASSRPSGGRYGSVQGLRVALRRAGVALGYPRSAVVHPLMGHHDALQSGVGSLCAHTAVAFWAALLRGTVARVHLDKRYVLPRTIDPHLASVLFGNCHGARVPWGGGAIITERSCYGAPVASLSALRWLM